jgi:hypothetical protein
MKKIRVKILIIICCLLFFPTYVFAYKLNSSKIYTSYNEHNDISECDALRKQWQSVSHKCGETGLCFETSGTEIIQITNEADLCYSQIAAKENDSSICYQKNNFSFPLYQSLCFTELAISNNDISYCEKINEIEFPVDSLSAIPKDDQKNLQDDECFRDFAVYYGDFFSCNRITELDTGFKKDYFGFKQDCYIKTILKKPDPFTKDPDLCKYFSEFNKGGVNGTKDDQSLVCYSTALNGLFSHPELLEEIAKNPNACSKYPDPLYDNQNYDGKAICYDQALARLTKPDMGDFLGKNASICDSFIEESRKSKCFIASFDSLKKIDTERYLAENSNLCMKYPEDLRNTCFKTSLESLEMIDEGRYLAENPDFCLRYPEYLSSKCYSTAESGIIKYNIDNRVCDKFPASELISENIMPNILTVLSFKKVLKDAPGREKCYFITGINFGNWSQNDPDFIRKNLISIIILVVFFLSDVVALVYNCKRKIKISVYIMIFISLSYTAFFWAVFSKLLFLEINYFYSILEYIVIISWINVILSAYLRNKDRQEIC